MSKSKRFALLVFCLLLVDCAIPDKAVEPKQTSTESFQLEQEVHRLINLYRLSRNLPPLEASEPIAQQARAHSRAMATQRVPLGHNGFSERVEWISRFLPCRAAAENVAYNKGFADSAQRAARGWLDSRGHRRNIEGTYRLTGIGVAKDSRGTYYFTQIFWD